MKTTVLAAVAAFSLALSVAPTFAASMGGRDQAQRSESSGNESQCHNIIANPDAYPASVVRKCKWQYQ